MSNTTSILKHNYETAKQYKEAYKQAMKDYEFKVQVDGGWMFFKYATDLNNWKKQK